MWQIILILMLCSAFCLSAVAKEPAQITCVESRIDWAKFLGQHDMVWQDLPHQWNEGAFLGNGQLGLMVYATLKDNRIDFHLGRMDVTDHRGAPNLKTSRGLATTGVMYDFCRLDIGRIALRPAGKILGGTMRVDLWNAQLSGTIKTDLGQLQFRAVVLRDRMVDLIEVDSSEKTAAGTPAEWKWDFLPGNPMSPRAQVFPKVEDSRKYVTNPPPVRKTIDSAGVCVQPLLAGGDYATAWLDKRTSASTGALFITTANEVPQAGQSEIVARKDVADASNTPINTLLATHRDGWQRFYLKSFLTIPDAKLESFYWIQIFKLGCASRPDAPPMDCLGPFMRVTQWPGLWWNLNVQITYWATYATNHLTEGENLISEIDQNFPGLLARFGPSPKLGDFAWVMHNYWLHYRYAGDWKSITEKWMPKAKAVIEAYQTHLTQNALGQIELLPMESPEYKGFQHYKNSNYNLALLRWTIRAYLEAQQHAGQGSDEAISKLQEQLQKLVPPPTNQNGLMIGSDQPVDMSHRHFSHLMGLYPLFTLNPDSPEDRELVVKSVGHWHHIEKGKGLAGYSYTGAASLYNAMGMGEQAHDVLSRFLNGQSGISILLPQTLYVESGGKNPVLETPFTVASATTEFLIQSWGGKIRVFPSVPPAWKNAQFHQLCAQGGFLVSARRENGRTKWIAIASEAGEPCILRVTDWNAAPVTAGAQANRVTMISPGEFRIDLKQGEQVLLHPPGEKPVAVIDFEPIAPGQSNLYGLKSDQHLKADQNWPEVPIANER